MRLSATGLEAGAEAHLERYVAANLRALDQAPDLLDPADAGVLLATALIPNADGRQAIEACNLVSIDFDNPGEPMIVPAESLVHHPLLAPWIGVNLGDMVGRMLMAGAIWTRLAPGSPNVTHLELIEGGGRFFANVRMVFPFAGGSLSVIAQYGERPASVAMSKALRVTGEALFHVGATARQVTLAATPSLIPAMPQPAQAAVTLH